MKIRVKCIILEVNIITLEVRYRKTTLQMVAYRLSVMFWGTVEIVISPFSTNLILFTVENISCQT